MSRALDEQWMREALQEARRGLGKTSPNPCVGALLVRGGEVVGRGHHARAGAPHAEVVAIRAAGEAARGATLYTTLEPCDHFGRTPPCSRAILEAGVTRVVSGSRDPNPLVNGRGVRRLRRGGVEVETGVLRAECDALNEAWMTFIRLRRPHVTLKVASTLDGKIATATGDSRWVTGPQAREMVHRLRGRVDAVLVGAGTARADDPRLTARVRGARDPLRVVLDSRARLPRTLRLFREPAGAPTVVAHVRAGARRPAPGVEMMQCRSRRGRVDLADLLDRLARRGVTSLLVEGGGEVARSFLEAGLVDRLLLFLAPSVVGGDGISWLAAPGARRMADARRFRVAEVARVGEDLLVTAVPGNGDRKPRVD